MVKVLGLADLLAGVVLLAQALSLSIPASMILFFAAYLIIKGGIFVLNSLDLGSVIDVMAGAILLAGLFLTVPHFLLFAFGGVLFAKGILSLLA